MTTETLPRAIETVSHGDNHFAKVAEPMMCGFKPFTDPYFLCENPAFWRQIDTEAIFRCTAHLGGQVEKHWVFLGPGRYYCEHYDCQELRRGGVATWAEWKWIVVDRLDTAPFQYYLCNRHVPMEDGTIGMAGGLPPVPTLDYPLTLTEDNIPWEALAGAGMLRRFYHGDDNYSWALGVTASMVGKNYSVPQSWLRPVLRLLASLDFRVEVNGYGGIITPNRILTNANELMHRSQARMQYVNAKNQLTAVQARWFGLRNVRPNYFDPSLLIMMAQEAATWPEVMATAGPGETMELETGHSVTAAGDALLIRFWPVFYDGSNETQGLTTPMVFEVSANGNVKWVGASDMSCHPHAYHDSAGALCVGEARFGHGNFAASFADLHDWWVGTDGGPATADWGTRSANWWDRYRERFFATWGEARYIEAPEAEDDEAKVLFFDDAKLTELLAATPRFKCYSCGNGIGSEDEPSYVCDRCDRRYCGDCFGEDDSYCANCNESYSCSRCDEVVSRGDDERYWCRGCEEYLCYSCFNHDGGRSCARCLGEEDEDEEAPAATVVLRSQYEVFAGHDGYECEAPDHMAYLRSPGNSCQDDAVYQLIDRSAETRTPQYLCELHYNELPVALALAVDPAGDRDTVTIVTLGDEVQGRTTLETPAAIATVTDLVTAYVAGHGGIFAQLAREASPEVIAALTGEVQALAHRVREAHFEGRNIVFDGMEVVYTDEEADEEEGDPDYENVFGDPNEAAIADGAAARCQCGTCQRDRAEGSQFCEDCIEGQHPATLAVAAPEGEERGDA